MDGSSDVDTASFVDTGIKSGLANAPWVVFAGLVLCWGQRTLQGPHADR